MHRWSLVVLVVPILALMSAACGDDTGSSGFVPGTPIAAPPAVATTVPTRPAASATAPATKSPAQVVADFYNWYLDYAQTRNPLVDHAYRGRPELSAAFIATLDRATSGTLQADPVLCAQNVPEKVTPGAATVTGDTAILAMTSSFEGHRWSVLMDRATGPWLISDVRCGR